MEDYTEEILERITSLERLDNTLKVVGIRGYFVLGFFVLLIICCMTWSVMGTIPVIVSGKCIVFNPESIVRVRSEGKGVVREVKIKTGDSVSQGQILVVLENPDLLRRIHEQRKLVSTLENDNSSQSSFIAQRDLRELENQSKNLTLAAPVEGHVSWLNVVAGDEVSPEEVLIWLQKPFPPEDLTVLGFFSLSSGMQIRDGMDVQVALDGVNSATYGMLKGTVKQVLPYPISQSDFFLDKIPSESLRKYLTSGSVPTMTVVMTPIADPGNPSGLEWTSRKGPPNPIQPGSIGEARVILGELKPISFLFPVLRKESK